MAEAIGISSGLLTLVAFALKSGEVLCQTVSSFRSSQRVVRSLKQELDALVGVLRSLEETASGKCTSFDTLKLPLIRCGKACEDFNGLIKKCAAHSDGSRRSVRDWVTLKYMGEDISGFTQMLEGYKSTINIALGDANLRAAKLTASGVEEYKVLISNTTSDLQEHLKRIDQRLQILCSRGHMDVESEAERVQLQTEMESAQKCLEVCAQVSAHINQIQHKDFQGITLPADDTHVNVQALTLSPSAHVIAANALGQCKLTLGEATAELGRRIQGVEKKLEKVALAQPNEPDMSIGEMDDLREEIDSVKQCLAICAQASERAEPHRTNMFEDVSMATDGKQIIVSTVGDLISGKRINAGDRSMQLLGQMSDQALEQLSQDHRHYLMEGKYVEKHESAGPESKFGQYGTGRQLNVSNLRNTPQEPQLGRK